MRRTFLILGLATVSVGLWVLLKTAPVNAACAPASPGGVAAVSTSCSKLLSSYFLGYALMVSGLVTMVLAALSMAKYKRRRYDYRRDVQPIAHRRVHDANESQRRAA